MSGSNGPARALPAAAALRYPAGMPGWVQRVRLSAAAAMAVWGRVQAHGLVLQAVVQAVVLQAARPRSPPPSGHGHIGRASPGPQTGTAAPEPVPVTALTGPGACRFGSWTRRPARWTQQVRACEVGSASPRARRSEPRLRTQRAPPAYVASPAAASPACVTVRPRQRPGPGAPRGSVVTRPRVTVTPRAAVSRGRGPVRLTLPAVSRGRQRPGRGPLLRAQTRVSY